MIILDTNIISELMKAAPNNAVFNWANQQPLGSLSVTATGIGEIIYGLQLLPLGARKLALERAFETLLKKVFLGKCIEFDSIAAKAYGELMANRKNIGKPMSIGDAQIAAIALSHQATLATRNTADFADCYLDLVNPFLDTPTLETPLQAQ